MSRSELLFIVISGSFTIALDNLILTAGSLVGWRPFGVADFALAVTLIGPLRDECGTRSGRHGMLTTPDLRFSRGPKLMSAP